MRYLFGEPVTWIQWRNEVEMFRSFGWEWTSRIAVGNKKYKTLYFKETRCRTK